MKSFTKFIFISTLLVLLVSPAETQTWFKHYGGGNVDRARAIQQTSDGGYIVAGETTSYSFGSYDFAVYKLSSSGNKVWFKHYGGTSTDKARAIQQTSDGGYIVAGETTSYTHGAYDIAIYKLNSSGSKVWFKHYGGPSHEAAYSVQQTSDGGYIVAGYTYSYSYGDADLAIYRLNSSGNKVWFRHYGGADYDYAYSIQQTSDGGYIVAGDTESYSYGLYDYAIYKLNSGGNKTWFKHYGGTSSDVAYSIQQTSDGGYIVAGYIASYTHGGRDAGIYKLNSSGNKVWFKHYGGSTYDEAYSIQQTSAGDYVVAGFTDSFSHGGDDFSIYRLNSSGNKVWFKHYGGISDDSGRSIDQTSDGGFAVAGETQSFTHGNEDFAIYKLDNNGDK